MPDDFENYVVNRGPVLLRFAYLLTGDRHLAEDLVQEVLARAHRRWSRVVNADSPDAYLRKAIVNQHLSWRRRRSSGERVTAEPADANRSVVSDHADRHADEQEVWTMLAKLSPKQRAVLVLRYYEDLDYEQIAALLGCTAANARGHVSRALTHLREQHAGSLGSLTGGHQ